MLGMCYGKGANVDPAYRARLFNYGQHQASRARRGAAAALPHTQRGAAAWMAAGASSQACATSSGPCSPPWQVDYVLGDCGRSWLVGFGKDYPQARVCPRLAG